MGLFYSTGQTAEQLGVSQDSIRHLCKTGLIKTETTPGGQLRIPESELERLKATGVPTAPRPMPGDTRLATSTGPGDSRSELLARPSDNLVQSAERVAMLGHEVKALRLTRRRDRELDLIDRRTQRILRERAAEEAQERARQEAAEARVARREWLQSWEACAVKNVPWGADPQVKLDVQAAVRERLSGLDPLPTDQATAEIVGAIISAAVRRAAAGKDSEAAVQRAMQSLPWDIRQGSKYAADRDEALHLMTEAAGKLPKDASGELREATARRAAAPVLQRYNHQKARTEILDGLPALLPGADMVELDVSRKTIATEMEKLSVGASRSTLETLRNQMLVPVIQAVRLRLDEAHRKTEEEDARREAASRRSVAEFSATLWLSHVNRVVHKLEDQGELEFEGPCDRSDTCKALVERIRPLLVEDLVSNPAMKMEEAKKRIEALVLENLDAVIPG